MKLALQTSEERSLRETLIRGGGSTDCEGKAKGGLLGGGMEHIKLPGEEKPVQAMGTGAPEGEEKGEEGKGYGDGDGDGDGDGGKP
jgi:hypothetical protein